MLLRCVALSAVGFLSGSLMYSYFITKALKNVDVRSLPGGDGNPGSSNAIRAAGVKVGVVCMVLDVMKAFVPVFVAVTIFSMRNFYLVPVVAAPVLGHAFSPFLGFRGGKAVSATFGALLALWPVSQVVLMLAIVMAFFKFIAVVKPDSTGVTVSLCMAIILSLFLEPHLYIKLAFALVSFTVIYRMRRSPDRGEPSVNVWRFSWTFEDSKLKFHKI